MLMRASRSDISASMRETLSKHMTRRTEATAFRFRGSLSSVPPGWVVEGSMRSSRNLIAVLLPLSAFPNRLKTGCGTSENHAVTRTVRTSGRSSGWQCTYRAMSARPNQTSIITYRTSPIAVSLYEETVRNAPVGDTGFEPVTPRV